MASTESPERPVGEESQKSSSGLVVPKRNIRARRSTEATHIQADRASVKVRESVCFLCVFMFFFNSLDSVSHFFKYTCNNTATASKTR